jgi:hypothetical protein
MNTSEAVATIVVAVLAVIGGVFAALKLVYRRGGDEREWTAALHENTASNKELSGQLGAFKVFTVDRLHAQALDHATLTARVDVLDTRVELLEKKG